MVYFIDFQGYCYNENPTIKELCIMDSNDILNPKHIVYKLQVPWENLSDIDKTLNEMIMKHHLNLRWDEGYEMFCRSCLINSYEDDITKELFYTKNESRMITLKKIFPMLRFVKYESKTFPEIPKNIKCPFREHGEHCAYKSCLSMCIEYFKC